MRLEVVLVEQLWSSSSLSSLSSSCEGANSTNHVSRTLKTLLAQQCLVTWMDVVNEQSLLLVLALCEQPLLSGDLAGVVCQR